MKSIQRLFIVSAICAIGLIVQHLEVSNTYALFKGNRYLFIKASPNPASSKLALQLYGLYSVKAIEKCYIADVLGRNVLDLTKDARKHSDGKMSFFDGDVSNLIPGAYLIVLQGDSHIRSKQVSIVR